MTSFANSLQCRIDIQETDKQLDVAFMEDADQNSIILECSSEAVIDKSVGSMNNSSAAGEDYLKTSHWPLKDPCGVNSSEFSGENFCIWEIASITPKSTEKILHESANQTVPMEYSNKTISPARLKDIPSGISVETKHCVVTLRDILLACDELPGKKTGNFSSSMESLGCGEIISSNVTQSQPLKSDSEADSYNMNADNHSIGKRNLNSFHEKKLPMERVRLVKKRPWKHSGVPSKRKCLASSFPPLATPVSLKNSSSRISLDPHKGLITNKDFLETTVTLPNSIKAQSLPFHCPLETVIETVNTDSRTENKRRVKPYCEKNILTESTKAVNVFQRKRQCVDQLVDKTLTGDQSLSHNETCIIVKFPASSDENLQISSVEHASIHNEHLNKISLTNYVSDDVIAGWTSPSASDENFQLISGDLAVSKRDVNNQNCLWEAYSGEELFSVPYSDSVLASASTELGSDENAALANELKNWEPFSACTLSETAGAVKVDAELAVQESVASGTSLASMELVHLMQPAKKRERRKSMSADREIASQMVENRSPQKFESGQAFSRKQYSQRLRRRSTELRQFIRNEVYSDVPQTSMNCPIKGQPEPNMPRARSKIEVHLGSETYVNSVETRLGFENTVTSGDDLTLDLDASILDTDLNLYSAPAKSSHRLRRKSTEFYRLSRNNQQSPLASVEETLQQQESTASQNAQNDIMNTEFKGLQSGMNISSKCPKRKKGKAEKDAPLEDIYLNRLWRSQMPKGVSWETIPEEPKYNKETGGLRVFSVRKIKRFLDFEEGPSLSRLKSRKQKAMKLGWKPLTKRKETALNHLLMQKLSQLDEEIGVGREHV